MIRMKLLFVCDAAVIEDRLRCPGWVQGIVTHLGADFSVTFLSSESFDPAGVDVSSIEGTTIGLLPYAAWNTPEQLCEMVKREKADVIVIFGTEKTYSLGALTLCEKAGLLDKTVIFSQGMALACAKHYAEGVPCRVIRRWTFRDLLRRENIRVEQKKMEARAKNEKQIITAARRFIGRTSMDEAIIRMYHPDADYYRCNDILRSAFYQGAWRYDDCEKHRIFVSQYYYPLKGFHYLLEAAYLLKEKYPDLTIAAAGYNPILRSVAENELKDSSYIRYLKKLIRRYGLEKHIELTGELDERQMKEQYLKANVFVLPSTIENSPNSLAEAMLLGVPCVASDVGGVSDFAEHRVDAYLYPSPATYLLAHYVDEIFQNPAEAARLGANAKKRAERDYDTEKNAKALSDVFRAIAKNN